MPVIGQYLFKKEIDIPQPENQGVKIPTPPAESEVE